MNRLVKELDQIKDHIINGKDIPEINKEVGEELYKQIVLKIEAQIRFEVYTKIIN